MTDLSLGGREDVTPLTVYQYLGDNSAPLSWIEEVACPECGSASVWFFALDRLQRGLKCRDCGAWDYL